MLYSRTFLAGLGVGLAAAWAWHHFQMPGAAGGAGGPLRKGG